MPSTPRPIHDTAAAFDGLPGIGPRAALRYAYWLAAQPRDLILRFSRTLEVLANGVERCGVCGAWGESGSCPICGDPKRDQAVMCVVGTNQDIRVIEESGAFKGIFHVLGGLLDPIEGRTPETLHINGLIQRLSAPDNQTKEIILALDPDIAGDTTALYLTKRLAAFPNINVTRLARGLQNGAQIEYADGSTIADAIQNRRKMG
jgi:recombination protein RecR